MSVATLGWLLARVLSGPLWAGLSFVMVRRPRPGWAAVVPPVLLALLPATWMATTPLTEWMGGDFIRRTEPLLFEQQVLLPGTVVIALAFGLALVGRDRRYWVPLVFGSIAASAWVSAWFPVVLAWRREAAWWFIEQTDLAPVRARLAVGAAALVAGGVLLAIERRRSAPRLRVRIGALALSFAGVAVPFWPVMLPADLSRVPATRLAHVRLLRDGSILLTASLEGPRRIGSWSGERAVAARLRDGSEAAPLVVRRPVFLLRTLDGPRCSADGRVVVGEFPTIWSAVLTGTARRIVAVDGTSGARAARGRRSRRSGRPARPRRVSASSPAPNSWPLPASSSGPALPTRFRHWPARFPSPSAIGPISSAAAPTSMRRCAGSASTR